MVDNMGHVAMGALWALPAWFIWTRRVALTFVGLTLLTSLLPDVDLPLQWAFPGVIHHHGVTHTVLFVTVVSLFVAALAAVLLTDRLDRWLGYDRFDRTSMFAFAFLAFLLGGLSHLFADMLSAPDVAQPIEPLWPVVTEPVGLDLIWYNARPWNFGLLVVAAVLHVVVAKVADPVEHRGRVAAR